MGVQRMMLDIAFARRTAQEQARHQQARGPDGLYAELESASFDSSSSSHDSGSTSSTSSDSSCAAQRRSQEEVPQTWAMRREEAIWTPSLPD